MSKRLYSYEMIQVSNHSTRQVDRSRRSEYHGQEYRPEIFIQTDDYDLILSSSPERKGAQWLSGRVLDSRPKGRGFEPHGRHCVVVLEQDTFILA